MLLSSGKSGRCPRPSSSLTFSEPLCRACDCSVWIRVWSSLVPHHPSPSFREFSSSAHLELAFLLSFSHLGARQPSLVHQPFTTALSAAMPRACSLAAHVVFSIICCTICCTVYPLPHKGSRRFFSVFGHPIVLALWIRGL